MPGDSHRAGGCRAHTDANPVRLRACRVGLGYDEGTVLVKIGREEPVASMDASGKVIWARHNEVLTANVRSLGADFDDVRPAARLPQTGCVCRFACIHAYSEG